MSGGPMLEVDGIDVFYGDIQVLYGLSLQVREGEIVTLLGSNGAGKTTTLRAISGTVATSGRVALDGTDIGGQAPDKIARRGIRVGDLAERIIRLTGSRSQIHLQALPVDDPPRRRPDITRAQEVLGWEPTIPLEEGLRRVLAHQDRVVEPVAEPSA